MPMTRISMERTRPEMLQSPWGRTASEEKPRTHTVSEITADDHTGAGNRPRDLNGHELPASFSA